MSDTTYKIEILEKKKPKPPTYFDIFYEAITQAAWLTGFILLAMRVIGEL